MDVPNLSEETALAWQAFDHAAMPQRVQPSAPILFFGNLEAYRASPLRVLTAGLNPSRNEFPDEEPFQRFPLLDGSGQDRDPGRYINALSSYFETAPYSGWFGAFEPLLNRLGSSFYQNSNAAARALHTDLCSPVATDPTWSGLDEANRQSLEADGTPLWHKLLETLQPQVVLLAVAQRYLRQIQFEPLTDWETIYTFTETANGDPRAQPYPILVRWYKVGDQVSMLAWGQAAQTPFGSLANTHKQEAGERLLGQYGQGPPDSS